MQCLGVETLRGMRNEYFSSLYQEAETFAEQKGIPATSILANSVVLPKRVQTLSSSLKYFVVLQTVGQNEPDSEPSHKLCIRPANRLRYPNSQEAVCC